MNKKRYITITIILVFLLLASILMNYTEFVKIEELENDLQTESVTYPEIYDIINSVSYNNLESFLKNNEYTVVYIGRLTCPDCSIFEPAFIKLISDFDLEEQIVYLNVAEIRKDDVEWENYKSKFNFNYTPTVAIYENSTMITKIEWTPEEGLSINDVKKWLETNHLI